MQKHTNIYCAAMLLFQLNTGLTTIFFFPLRNLIKAVGLRLNPAQITWIWEANFLLCIGDHVRIEVQFAGEYIVVKWALWVIETLVCCCIISTEQANREWESRDILGRHRHFWRVDYLASVVVIICHQSKCLSSVNHSPSEIYMYTNKPK